MKKQRDYSYDYLRAFAAVMIVLCHICQGFGISAEMGYYLGGTYVDVFLLLSAYLLGMSSRDKIASNPRQFLTKRVGRLVPTYYTFLTISFLVILVFIGADSLTGKQMFAHYMFLNWFWESARIYTSPLPQLGHLWFMSCIMFGYLLVLFISQMIRRFPAIDCNRAWGVFGVTVAILATLATIKYRILIYPFTVMLAFTLLFFKGREIMSYIRKTNHTVLVILLALSNMGGVIYYMSGGYDYPHLIFWINLINAFLWIANAPIVFSTTKIPRSILFISAISFEIYLIHHPMCLGHYSLKQYMPTWIASVCVFLFSIAGGWMLSLLTGKIIKLYHNVFK